MKKVAMFIVTLFLFSSLPAMAKKPAVEKGREVYIQQQMVLLGLYVYGVTQELEKTVPNYFELEFLADSMLNIATEIKDTKDDILYHRNLTNLLKNILDLKEASKNDHDSVKEKADKVINTCGSCHSMGQQRLMSPVSKKN